MTLVRWNPTRHRMMPTVHEWDRLMNDVFTDRFEDTSLSEWTPAIDIIEDNDAFIVVADYLVSQKKILVLISKKIC